MTYCVSDIHGCYEEFMELLEQINFSDDDTLYVLGDVTDRGPKTLECYEFIYSKANIICIMGNHEDLMFKFFPGRGKKSNRHWLTQGGDKPLKQILKAKRNPETKAKWDEMFNWIKSWPLYLEVMVNGKLYFLSHAGVNIVGKYPEGTEWEEIEKDLDFEKILAQQEPRDFFWSREIFFNHPSPPGRHCVFGHSSTYSIRENQDCSIWVDPLYNDKTCIDGGCVYGGALTALRLEDGAMFHVKSRQYRDPAKPQLYIGIDG